MSVRGLVDGERQTTREHDGLDSLHLSHLNNKHGGGGGGGGAGKMAGKRGTPTLTRHMAIHDITLQESLKCHQMGDVLFNDALNTFLFMVI